MQGWTRFAPLVAPLMRLLVALYWRLGPGLTAFLPLRVRAVLTAPFTRAELIRIVREIATDPERSDREHRERARETVGSRLRAIELDLTEQELTLLVELLYGKAMRHRSAGIPPGRRRVEGRP